MKLIIESEGVIDATLMHDNYTVISELDISDENWTGTTDVFEEFTIRESGDVVAEVYYAYVSQEGMPMNEIYEFDDNATVDSEEWMPVDEESHRTEINMDDIPFVGQSGDDEIMDTFGIDRDELSATDSVLRYNSTESMHYLAQTPEDDEGVFNDRSSYWQGWTDLQQTIEDNVLSHLAEKHNVNERQITIIDYYIEDLQVVTQYQQDMREEIRNAYADAFLQVAEEEGWDVYFESLDDDDDDGWRTVDDLMARDDFTRMEIQGNIRYGEPETLERWSNSFTRYEYSINGVSFGDNELDWYRPWEDDERSDMIEDIIDGDFEVDMGETVDDVTEPFSDVAEEMKEMTASMFSVVQSSVDDVAERFERTWTDIEGRYEDMNVFDAQHLQASNLGLASAIEGSMMTDLVEWIEDEFAMAMSIDEAFENLQVDGERVFDWMRTNDDETFGKVASQPLTVGTANPTITITTIVIVVFVAILVVAGAITWSMKDDSRSPPQNETVRR